MATRHRITVARLPQTWQDVLAQPDPVSLDEQYPDGRNVHDYADDSSFGRDPLETLLLREQFGDEE